MIIHIKVKSSSGKQEVIEKDGNYLVNLKSPPENNRANIELIKLLKKYFNVEEIKIKSGFSSRNKIVEIKRKV